MQYIRRQQDRGTTRIGWLDSRHSFSFGRYYDPHHMGFSVLRVINDDVVAPGQGFGTHGHRDMEIISYVVSGTLKHTDSTGNDYEIPAGDIQRMSAGRGILHSEFNPSEHEPVNFLQIWILPDTTGVTPEYEQKTIVRNGALTPLVTSDGRDNSLRIQQDVAMYKLDLETGESLQLNSETRYGYLHIVKGDLQVKTAELDDTFSAGDAIGVTEAETLAISAREAVEAIWFDLPVVKH